MLEADGAVLKVKNFAKRDRKVCSGFIAKMCLEALEMTVSEGAGQELR